MSRAEFCQLLNAYASAEMTVALRQERRAPEPELRQALNDAANARSALEFTVFHSVPGD